MATPIDRPMPEEATLWTTSYQYYDSLPCEKVNIQELASQMLPPLYALVFGVGLVGNVMVLLILTKYRRLRILPNIYLLNLAVSDLLFLSTLPFYIHSIKWNSWVFGNGMCKLLAGIYYMGLYGESFFIILMTVDRYLAIVHAVLAQRFRTVTFGIISSVLTWVLVGLAALPDFIFHKSQVALEQSFCSSLYPAEEEDTWKCFQAVRINVLCLVLPLLIMAVCYAGIIKTLMKCPSKKKDKAIRLIFVIMVVFFLFWTPYNLVILFFTFQSTFFRITCERNKQLDVALQVTEVIAFTHCCVNPVIYAFVGERFRQHLRHFLHRHVGRRLGKHIPVLARETSERASSVSPSTGEQELSAVF